MVIGIDLGTTNSAVAYMDENGNPQMIINRDGERITPSVILFDGENPVVGSVAKNNSVSDPLNVVQFVKRQMGNPNFNFLNENGEKFTSEELSAIILKKLKEDAESILGKKVDKAVITVPAYFDDAQRKATQDAGRIAGLEVLKVINEPTAAALAYGITKKCDNTNIMVYDLGGGTFDVTIMNFNEGDITIKATGGDRNLGGFDFDNKIIEYIIKQFEEQHGIDLYSDEVAIQELREKAEACKKTLSNRSKSMISLSSQGKMIKENITKDQFDKMIEPLLDKTTLIMDAALEDANLTWSEIDKVLLVGGSTRIRKVQELIERESGKKPSSEANPDEIVSMGAAIQGYILDDSSNGNSSIKNTKITDVNSHSLGMLAINKETNRSQNCIILPRNTPIPAEAYEEFYTMYDGQGAVDVEITEGEDENPEYIKVIGTTTLKLNKRPAESPIKIVVGYDENSVVQVRVIDLVSNEDLGEMHIERTSNLSAKDVKEKSDKILKLRVE